LEEVATHRARPGLRAALVHRDYRYLLGGLVVSSIGDWLYNVALIVYVLDRTGSPAWITVLVICRTAPVALLSTYGGALADRLDRRRLMLGCDLIRGALMFAVAVAAARDAPVLVVVLIASACSAVSTPYFPAVGAMTPALVGEEDLAAANSLSSAVDNIAITLGPALGGLILAVGGSPPAAFSINAVTFLVSAALVWRIRTSAAPEAGDAEDSLAARLVAGFQAFRSSRNLMLLALMMIAFTITFGQELVLYPLVSLERLGWGTEGVGFILALSGVGGILGVGLSSRLARSRRPAVILVVALIAASAPLFVMAATTNPAPLIPILLLEGAAIIVADVVTITTIQRVAPKEVVGRALGIMTTVSVTGIMLGSLVAPLTERAFGLTGALVFGGAFLVACAVAGLPRAKAVDRVASARAQELAGRVEILARLRIFDGASTPVLESLAGSLRPETTAAGETVVSEGETADAIYVVVAGDLAVTSGGSPIRRLGAGDYFGEIGVLEGMSRTATVRADSICELYRIDGEDFLQALSGAPMGARTLADTMTGRLARTHPAHRVAYVPTETP
jgi:predicted MFS family arabinose efflux permease